MKVIIKDRIGMNLFIRLLFKSMISLSFTLTLSTLISTLEL